MPHHIGINTGFGHIGINSWGHGHHHHVGVNTYGMGMGYPGYGYGHHHHHHVGVNTYGMGMGMGYPAIGGYGYGW